MSDEKADRYRDVGKGGDERWPRIGLLELLASWEPLDEELPDVDAALLPLGDIHL